MKKLSLCLLFCLLAAVSCGKKNEGGGAAEEETGGKLTVGSKDEGVSVATGSAAKLPDNFPSDVYVYKGAAVIMTMQVPNGQLVTLQTKDEVDKVMEKYKKELTSSGWSQKTSMEGGGQKMYMYEKGTRMATVTIARVDDATQISVTVTTK